MWLVFIRPAATMFEQATTAEILPTDGHEVSTVIDPVDRIKVAAKLVVVDGIIPVDLVVWPVVVRSATSMFVDVPTIGIIPTDRLEVGTVTDLVDRMKVVEELVMVELIISVALVMWTVAIPLPFEYFRAGIATSQKRTRLL